MNTRGVPSDVPLLPRLLKGDVIRRTVSDGVSQKVFGYARRNSDGQLKLERFGESLAEMEVELSEDVFLLKAADAQKLLEPPRVAALTSVDRIPRVAARTR